MTLRPEFSAATESRAVKAPLAETPVVSAPLAGAAPQALRFESADAAGSTATTYRINVGDSFNGSLGAVADSDWVRVTLQPGRYEITLDGRGLGGLSDPYLRVRDAAGNVIDYNDDSGAGRNSKLELNVTSAGTYYLDASSYANRYSGAYTLSIDNAPSRDDVLTTEEIAEQLTDGFWDNLGGSRRAFDIDQGDVLNVDLSRLTADGQRLASMALSVWEEVLGITFNRNPGAGVSTQITFDDREANAYSTSQVFGETIISSFVNIGTEWLTAYGTGFNTYSYQTYIHEIGHALGLGHAGNYNGTGTYGVDNDYANDSWQASVMSYFSQDDNTSINASYAFVLSAMTADIAAMQDLYGMESIRSGNNIYGEQSNAGAGYSTIARMLRDPSTRDDITFTIFDQGGYDTLDLSRDTNNQRIWLTPGQASNAYGLVGNISIAEGTLIERLNGGRGNDFLSGNWVGNMIVGGTGNDTIYGRAGNDTLLGQEGNDLLIGGAGDDVYFIDDGDRISELAGQGEDTVRASISYTLDDNLEHLQLLGNAATSGHGNGANNNLVGNSAGNILYGHAGNDTLLGNGGNDTLVGSSGADWMVGGAGSDVLFGGGGNDFYILQDGNDRIVESGGGGWDIVRSSVSIRLAEHVEELQLQSGAALTGHGNGDDNRMVGNAAGNILYGLAGNDTLFGLDGNDTLLGQAGADLLAGGNGNDIYFIGAGDGVFESANQGTDTVRATVTHSLGANFEHLQLLGDAALNGNGNGDNNRLIGNAGENVLRGYDGNDTLQGQAGEDTLQGGAGNDWLVGGAGRDILRGEGGNDHYILDGQDQIDEGANGGIDTVYTAGTVALMANVENLVMNGSGAQNGYGNALDNRITGNQSDNLLSGGAGNDTMIGGAGSDVFLFNLGRDIVADFQNDVDTLRIDDRYLGRSYTVDQALALAEVIGGNAVFDFGNGHRLTLNGVTDIASLSDDLVII